MSEPRITYATRPDATHEAEIATLAAVYRIVLSAKTRGRLLDKSGPHDAILRNSKGVSHVNQRPG
jgi:hypothetical protein